MYRISLFFILIFPVLALHGNGYPSIYSDWKFKTAFTVYHGRGLTQSDAAALGCGGNTDIKNRKEISVKEAVSLEPAQDFNALFGYAKPHHSRVAIAVSRIEVEKDGRIQLGVGADWLIAVFIDGKKVFDTIELGGNGTAPGTKNDHVVDVELKKGGHTVSLWLSSGSTTWSVAAGKIPYRKIVYSDPELKYGPYLTDVSTSEAVISFTTTIPGAAGVEIRKKGDSQSRIFWDETGYQINVDNKLHRIKVEKLEPDTVYEYNTVFLGSLANNLIRGEKKYVLRTASHSFKPFKMFVTGDMQYLPDVQRAIVSEYMATSHARSSSFFVSLGDSSGEFNNFEKSMFETVLNPVSASSNCSKNIIMVRGNHEYRGRQTRFFTDYFGMNGKTYGLYVYNNVAFLILDSGNGSSRNRAYTRHYSAHDLMDKLLAEQRSFIARAVKSREFKEAKYRVVLAHAAVFGTDGPISKFTRSLVEGLLDKRDIHLWLSGHIHRYRRTVPGAAGFYGFSPAGKRDFIYTDGKYPFVTMTTDGPGAEFPHSGHTVEFLQDGIKVNSFDSSGKVFDSFKIDGSGKVIESVPGKELKFYSK